ncbi:MULTISPECIES: helicase [Microbacterium]|uniref:helicase n=1 Tax=Microbacterium TaxID=33882 RepID=UPI002006C40B|nr:MULTISPECIES: helicase [Microbacterium]
MPGTATAVGLVAAAATLTAALCAVSGAAVHGQKLAAAADAAALAAADAASGAVAGVPCDRAGEVAAAAGAAVVACDLDGLVATVTVSAPLGVLPASATARAGPPAPYLRAAPRNSCVWCASEKGPQWHTEKSSSSSSRRRR